MNSRSIGGSIMRSINPSENKSGGIRSRVEHMEEIEQLHEFVSAPKSMKVEVSASCNLRCSFCFHKSSGRSGLMSLSNFRKCMEIASDYSIQQVGLLFLGEPTLNPLLPEMIYIAKREYHIPYVFITSNGIVNRSMLDDILHSPLDSLKWSVNFANAESFKHGTGVDGFHQLNDNIIYAYNQACGTKLYASSTVYDVNNLPRTLTDYINSSIIPYVDEHYYFQLNNQGGLIQDDHFKIPYCNRLPILPCPRLFNNTYITYDMKVAMCCSAFTESFILGDISKTPFEEIWNGEKMRALRRKHISGNIYDTICGGHYDCKSNANISV